MKDDRILLKIAILGGTGKEGSGLALRWARAGYFVIIGSRSAERADQAAYEINRQLGMDNAQGMDNESACKEADIVVLTVPPEAQIATLEGVREPLAGKILVDDLLGPDVKVVAAFQNVPAHALKKLDVELASDVMVCGDDPEARAQTVELAEAAGMKAYEAGGLDNGIVVEGLTALIIAMNKRYKSKVGGIRVSGINKDSEPGR
ncbi:MAG: NAD(P)-binding domain-containing protein [Anaerolineales bacterium]|nr:NAD(P)-binding domain-containing protein [Anaerolineales bacterium]